MTSGLAAEFSSADAVLAAVRALRETGYRAISAYTPFPIDGLDQALALPRSRLPVAVFAGGAIGAVVSYWIQWYANAWAYPLVVGGRPMNAIPAFIPATFEGTVLGAALAGFIALLIRLRLPALWHPMFEVDGFESATDDRFWLALDRDDPQFDPMLARRDLERLSPIRIVTVGEDSL
ncbi:MAG TPA: DUF3341 domain-containing protein [Gemmatimonadales bacterium]|nr:DUF3341 domain-containing protein [Gemmatimonadales bacterium]